MRYLFVHLGIAAAEIEIALGDADYDDIVDDKATVSVNMGVYDTPVDGVNDYCPTPGPPMASAYETPVNTLQKVIHATLLYLLYIHWLCLCILTSIQSYSYLRFLQVRKTLTRETLYHITKFTMNSAVIPSTQLCSGVTVE